RGVDDAVFAVLGLQSIGDAEDAAVEADILAEEDDLGIGGEGEVEGVVDGTDEGHLRHLRTPGAGGLRWIRARGDRSWRSLPSRSRTARSRAGHSGFLSHGSVCLPRWRHERGRNTPS